MRPHSLDTISCAFFSASGSAWPAGIACPSATTASRGARSFALSPCCFADLGARREHARLARAVHHRQRRVGPLRGFGQLAGLQVHPAEPRARVVLAGQRLRALLQRGDELELLMEVVIDLGARPVVRHRLERRLRLGGRVVEQRALRLGDLLRLVLLAEPVEGVALAGHRVAAIVDRERAGTLRIREQLLPRGDRRRPHRGDLRLVDLGALLGARGRGRPEVARRRRHAEVDLVVHDLFREVHAVLVVLELLLVRDQRGVDIGAARPVGRRRGERGDQLLLGAAVVVRGARALGGQQVRVRTGGAARARVQPGVEEREELRDARRADEAREHLLVGRVDHVERRPRGRRELADGRRVRLLVGVERDEHELVGVGREPGIREHGRLHRQARVAPRRPHVDEHRDVLLLRARERARVVVLDPRE